MHLLRQRSFCNLNFHTTEDPPPLSQSEKKRGSTDAYLQVSKGQFMTHVDGGSMKIKFDKAAPKTYSYSNSADGSSDIIFVNGVSDVIFKNKSL